MPISAEAAEKLLAKIKEKKWWQGALIPGTALSKCDANFKQSQWWIISSQTCNLYNINFHTVPVFEVVAAKEIECLDPIKLRGDNPRTLHLEARSDEKALLLEVDIQNRLWCPRKLLSELPAPTYAVIDTNREKDANWIKKQWLDNFIGWMGRSYSRVALPDAFNIAMNSSKLKEIFDKKLTKQSDNLYGIYFLIDSNIENHNSCRIGQLEPPYLLEIVLVTHEDIDPEPIKKQLLKQLFVDKIKDPDNKEEFVTRANLARRNEIILIEAGIEVLSVTEITLHQLKSLIRYSHVDHHSDSTMAIPID